MDIFNLENFESLKSETKKYQAIARYLEQLCITHNLKEILNIESNEKYKPYIKYIGGIGNSRALQFCVSKNTNEKKSIALIEYIVNNLKNNKKNISILTITSMLNVAIIYEQEEIIDYIIKKPEFKNKVKFSNSNYLMIKNMTNPDDTGERRLLKKLLMEKIIPLDRQTRTYIEKSKDERIQDIVFKIDLKEKIEQNLIIKSDSKEIEVKNKKLKI